MSVQEPGRTLGGRYRLQHEIARGGMAVVWSAEDTLLERDVAIKLLHPQFATDVEFLERFRREARAAARLSHPNIVPIYDVGEDPSSRAPFIVMELVDGGNLKDRIRRSGQLREDDIRAIGATLAGALDYAHGRGIIHRDVKPQNILLGSDERARLTDFGIAQAITGSGLTRTGAVMGSVHYIAPELVRGRPASPQSDIYALGAVLYEMATGRVPFEGETDMAVALAHVEETPAAPRALNARVSPELEVTIMRALAKTPEARFGGGSELAAVLRGGSRGAGSAIDPAVAEAATQRLPTVPPSSSAQPAQSVQSARSAQPSPSAPPATPSATSRRSASTSESSAAAAAAAAAPSAGAPTPGTSSIPPKGGSAARAADPGASSGRSATASQARATGAPPSGGHARAASAASAPGARSGPRTAAGAPARHTARRHPRGASGGVLGLLLAMAAVLVALGAGFFGLATLSREGLVPPEPTVAPAAQRPAPTAPPKPVAVPSATAAPTPVPTVEPTLEPTVEPTAVPSPSPVPPTPSPSPAPPRPTATAPPVAVPQLRGKTLAQAQTALRADGLTWTVRGANLNVDKDVVADQTPDVGAALPPGGTVTIVVGTGATAIPDVTGQSRDQALRALQGNSFRVTVRQRRDNQVPEGQAIDTRPAAGTVAPRNAEVELSISSGR